MNKENQEKERELKPGETRDTKVETHTPGQPEKKEVEHKHEEGPEQK